MKSSVLATHPLSLCFRDIHHPNRFFLRYYAPQVPFYAQDLVSLNGKPVLHIAGNLRGTGQKRLGPLVKQ